MGFPSTVTCDQGRLFKRKMPIPPLLSFAGALGSESKSSRVRVAFGGAAAIALRSSLDERDGAECVELDLLLVMLVSASSCERDERDEDECVELELLVVLVSASSCDERLRFDFEAAAADGCDGSGSGVMVGVIDGAAAAGAMIGVGSGAAIGGVAESGPARSTRPQSTAPKRAEPGITLQKSAPRMLLRRANGCSSTE